jgi:putative redox protein
MVTAKMSWAGGLKFEGEGVFGHKITTDGAKEFGGSELGMAGCAGIDVVRIMEKQRQELTSLEIQLIGHQPEEYPKPFHTIEMKFIARGRNLDPAKLAKAIELSEQKYCVVSQTIQHVTKVVTSQEIVEG